MWDILKWFWDYVYKEHLSTILVNDFSFVDYFIERMYFRGLQSAEDFDSFDGMDVYKFQRVESIDRSCSSHQMILLKQPFGISFLWWGD